MNYLLVRGSQGPAVQQLRTALCKELGADAQPSRVWTRVMR